MLRGAVIGVYKDDKEYKMRHQIYLSELTACAELKSPKKEFVFGVFSPSRNWHLQGSSLDETRKWVHQIRQTARIEETDEVFLMSPTIQSGHLVSMASVKNDNKKISPPTSPGGRGGDGYLSSHTLDYSGASISSTSELGGMVSQLSLSNTPAESSNSAAAGRRASSGMPGGMGSVGAGSVPLQRSMSADPEPGVVRHESNLSTFQGHMSDSKVIWHGYMYVLKSKSGLRQWKKMWIVLRPRNLAFYKNEEVRICTSH